MHRTAGERGEKGAVASIPQTATQVTLSVISTVMAILGGVVLLAGGLVLFAALTGQAYASDSGLVIAGVTLSGWSPLGLAVVVLAAGALLLATAWLGLAASRDSGRVGPYRFLCYLVGLVLLVAILWSWGAGTILIFNPIVLSTTITYVVICSSLADRVQREHDEGVRGESFLLDGHQRALRLISQVIIVTAVLNAVITLIVWYAVSQMDPTLMVTLAESQFAAGVFAPRALGLGLASAGVNLLVGLLGLRGRADQLHHRRPPLWCLHLPEPKDSPPAARPRGSGNWRRDGPHGGHRRGAPLAPRRASRDGGPYASDCESSSSMRRAMLTMYILSARRRLSSETASSGPCSMPTHEGSSAYGSCGPKAQARRKWRA